MQMKHQGRKLEEVPSQAFQEAVDALAHMPTSAKTAAALSDNSDLMNHIITLDKRQERGSNDL